MNSTLPPDALRAAMNEPGLSRFVPGTVLILYFKMGLSPSFLKKGPSPATLLLVAQRLDDREHLFVRDEPAAMD